MKGKMEMLTQWVIFVAIWSQTQYERSLKKSSISRRYRKTLYCIFNKFSSMKILILIPKRKRKGFQDYQGRFFKNYSMLFFYS